MIIAERSISVMEQIRSVQSAISDVPKSAPTVGETPIRVRNIEVLSAPKEVEKKRAMTFDDAKEISRSIEIALNNSNKEVQFSVTPEELSGNKINFRVIDSSTGEVVREFPSEEVQGIADKALNQVKQGLLVDSAI
jgi:uncharacterized FlaG/YvyC family protein